jgi:putative heme-binding domain-containing protein
VKDPIAGSLIRISPDGKSTEAVCDGFRNAYSFDFNLDGEPFTFDSDNERCVGLPWYEPCRFYHIVPGGNYGWRSPQLSQTWRKPPYFPDVVPPIGTTGRGSPTGVACYRNTLFPSPYRGSFFIADWTFGKIWFVPLEKKQSSYAGKPEVFLEAVGESGFAPTALAVHPKTGELFVSIGGRGTRGAVYRIMHDRGGPTTELAVAKRSLEWNAEAANQWKADATGPDALKRRQALELLLRYRDKIGWGPWLGDLVKPNLSHDDPLIRAAAARFAVAAAAPVNGITDLRARLTIDLFFARDFPDECLQHALAVIGSTAKSVSVEHKLIAARVVQLALGDLTAANAAGTVGEGYTFRNPVSILVAEQVLKAIRVNTDQAGTQPRPPSTPELDREYARIIGAVSEVLPRVNNTAYFTGPWLIEHFKKDSDAIQDFHYLAVMSRMNPHWLRDMDNAVAWALYHLPRKADLQRIPRDRNWPLRWEETAAGLLSGQSYLTGYLSNRAHGPLNHPDHVGLIKHLKADEANRADLILRVISQNIDHPWTADTLNFLKELPSADTRPTLFRLWDRGGLEDAILPILAKEPRAEDAGKYVVGLRSLNPEVVKVSAAALNKLPPQKEKADLIAAILALRKLPDDKSAAAAREALVTFLKDRTGQSHTDAKSWSEWFAKAHPDLAAKLAVADGFDPAAWKKREAAIPWTEGDAERGRAAFTKATCAACHDGGGAIGPSLAGVSKRFSRDDLLTAILQPSRDVSPRYRPTRVATTDGKVHIGMIVYEATSGVILQTGPDTVVRIAGEQIESQKLLDTSLMPASLLDKLTDREVADLLAYLRSLR